MSEGNSNNSSVGIVAIVALLILVGVGAWFVWGRSRGPVTTTPATTSQPADTDIHVKVDLPDSVTIK
jgi:ABC-type transporter Mla subunit MlaD